MGDFTLLPIINDKTFFETTLDSDQAQTLVLNYNMTRRPIVTAMDFS